MGFLRFLGRYLAILSLVRLAIGKETLTTTNIVGSTVELQVDDLMFKAVTAGVPYTSTITSLSGLVTNYIPTVITPTAGTATTPTTPTTGRTPTTGITTTTPTTGITTTTPTTGKTVATVYPYTTTLTSTSAGVTLYISTVITGSTSGSTATVLTSKSSGTSAKTTGTSTATKSSSRLSSAPYTYTGTNPDPSSQFTVPPQSPVLTLSIDRYYTVTEGSKTYTSLRSATYMWVTITTDRGVAVLQTTYIQRYTSQYSVIRVPSSGSIGLGTISGTVGVIKTSAVEITAGSATTDKSKVIKVASANSAGHVVSSNRIPLIISFLSIFAFSLL